MSNAIKITTKTAKENLLDVLRAELVPMLCSSPGIGKSSIAHEIAKDAKLKVIDLRLSQCDPTDLNGFPTINKEKGKAGYVPMDTFPLEGDPIPKGYNGWLLLMDELNSAPLAVQAASYKIILDNMIGQQRLHKKVAIMGAGNLQSDKAIVNRMSTALQSRMVHFEMEIHNDHWSEWANQAGVDLRIQAFIKFKPDALHSFNPSHNDKTYACPRTWDFLSRIIKGWKEIKSTKLAVMSGTIGEGMAREFFGFCSIFESLPTIEEFIRAPESVVISQEPSIRYAISGLLAHHIDETNVDKLIVAVNRLPMEFQVITLVPVLKRIPKLVRDPSVRKWVSTNAQDLI